MLNYPGNKSTTMNPERVQQQQHLAVAEVKGSFRTLLCEAYASVVANQATISPGRSLNFFAAQQNLCKHILHSLPKNLFFLSLNRIIRNFGCCRS